MKIYLENEKKILERIKKRDVTISVIGIGTIGLPVATFLAKENFRVFGIDKNEKRVELVNRGEVPFEYGDTLKRVIEEGNLQATNDPEKVLKESDVAIICVPTPLCEKKEINLSYLENAAKSIANSYPKGMVIILESSVSIGSTRHIGNMIENDTGLKAGNDFGLVYTPERYNPTLSVERHPEIFYENSPTRTSNKYTLDKIPRIMGSIDKKGLLIAKNIYSKFIKEPITEVSCIEVAEITKLFENIFRDVNIALVNELSLACSKLGLNVYEVIEAAKTKPFAFLPHYPGLVGGECIPVDTWYLIKQCEKCGFDAKLMKTAREVNDYMAIHTVDLLKDALEKKNKKIKGSRIGILGLAYKKNVADSRVSLSKIVKEILEKEGAEVFICDPVVEMLDLDNQIKLLPLKEVFKDLDGIIIATDHDIFKKIDLGKIKNEMRTPIIVDMKNFYDGEKVKSLGYIYRGIGKPVD